MTDKNIDLYAEEPADLQAEMLNEAHQLGAVGALSSVGTAGSASCPVSSASSVSSLG
ncbi:thiocillin family RiPP [Planobispora longispora]|uniref:Thiocillin family RiPP n=1 Tax=Planobispora longispora TaxID=28887 RepID=A0A8J3RL58_9ACTN|nr:thiocillin family RiPP [Planobispora longispora]BFE86245.1 hypothetical protein GCM10020093_088460 [Planobispora longispora]GIH75822.1 hypothetical protein Plo01_22510 [Planobispora longispora]